jgi:hypothetical protein
MADEDEFSTNVVINCVAIFYEEGKGGENFRKKNKFRCLLKKDTDEAKRVLKLKETIW